MNNQTFTLQGYKKRWLKMAIDFAIFAIIFSILYFIPFKSAFDSKDERNLRLNTFINSYLYDQETKTILNSDDYLTYENVVKKYYVGKLSKDDETKSYFNSEFYLSHGGTRESKTIAWYNEKILGLPNSNIFQYQKDDSGKDILDEYGELQPTLFEIKEGNKVLTKENNEMVLNYFLDEYKKCFVDLSNDHFYSNAIILQNEKAKMRLFLSFVIPSFILFILIPLIIKNKTIGEIVTKSMYVNKNGLVMPKYKVIIKGLIPLILSLLILLNLNLFYFLSILIILGIINFVLSVYTSNRTNISEILIGVVLCDEDKTLTFDSEEEKQDYILKNISSIEQISIDYYRGENHE